MGELYRYEDEHLWFHHTLDEHPQDHHFSMHVHEWSEIFCFVSGDARYLVEGNEYPLEPGSVLLMRGAESHRVRILSIKPYERYALHFSADLLLSLDPDETLLAPFEQRPLGRRNLYIPQDFSGISPLTVLEMMAHPAETPRERRLNILCSLPLLLNILRHAFLSKVNEAADSISDNRIGEVVRYLNQHLAAPLSLERLSSRYFLSVSQLNRLFRKATGSTVWEYVLIKRLLAARRLIQSGIPAGKAAQQCGFGEYSAFYRAYRKRFGHSPREDGYKDGRYFVEDILHS